jgi:hypothetical protein
MSVDGCTQSYFHLCYCCCPCLGCAQRTVSCMGPAAAATPATWLTQLTFMHACHTRYYVHRLQLHFSIIRVHLMACAVASCTALLGDAVQRSWCSAHHRLLLKQAAAQVSTGRIGAVVWDGPRCLCIVWHVHIAMLWVLALACARAQQQQHPALSASCVC